MTPASRLLGRLAVALTLLVAACAAPISHYDATTYRNLTDLKVDATLLVASFDAKPVAENEGGIADVTTKLLKAYEYEKGKGKPNNDTVTQIEKVKGLFDKTVSDYRSGEKLGPKFFREASVQLGQAFDTAISTENLKNKDRQ
jgi:hypothetical protein